MSAEKNRPKAMKRNPTWIDIAQLLIGLFVPLTIITYTLIETQTERLIAKENRLQDLRIADERHEQSLILLEEEQQEATLVHYFDSLGKLLEKSHRLINLTHIIRFKTLTALSQLKFRRKSLLLRSLIENRLITLNRNHKSILDLSLADLANLDLTNQILDNNQLICINLSKTKLTNSSFIGLTILSSTFIEAQLMNSDFSQTKSDPWSCGSSLQYGINFQRAILDGSKFNSAKYLNANFKQASLNYVQMNSFQCKQCHFYFASMHSIQMSNTQIIAIDQYDDFQNTNLSSATIFNCSFIGMVFFQNDFRKSNLTKTIFNQTNLLFSKFENSLFIENTIVNATFFFSDLSKSVWDRTKISYTTFNKTTMNHFQFINSQCHFCTFDRIDFSTVNLTNSSFDGSDFRRTNLDYRQLTLARSFQNIILPNGTII